MYQNKTIILILCLLLLGSFMFACTTTEEVKVKPEKVEREVTLSINSPTNGQAIVTPTVKVTGSTEAGAAVTINGTQVAVDPQTATFEFSVNLQEGINTITVSASKEGRKTKEATLTVTRELPKPKQEDRAKLTAIEFYNAMIEIVNSAVPANKYLIAVVDNPAGVVGKQTVYDGLADTRETYVTLAARLENTKPPPGFEPAWNSLREYLRLCWYSAYYLADYVDTGVPKYHLWAVDSFNKAGEHKQQALEQLRSRARALGITVQ